MLAIVNKLSKSLAVELGKFLHGLGRIRIGSKQAFSRARYKLLPEAFIELNDLFIQSYYELGEYKLYADKYVLLASDGSDYELPYSQELLSEFGAADNKQNKQPMCMAKGVKIYDVLNGLAISTHLGRYDVAEIRHFKEAWARAHELLSKVVKAPLLLLGDMHYPSFWLIEQLRRQGTYFLFRCPPGFCRETKQFMSGSSMEAILHIPIAKDRFRRARYKTFSKSVPEQIQVRALKFQRPDGSWTCLITSLPGEEMDYQHICQLYPYRWAEEVSFNFDKNRVPIEDFASKKAQGIRQEWYAHALAVNLVQLVIEEAQQQLDEQQQQKDNKHLYQINQSVAFGLMKDELPKMLFGKEDAQLFFQRMVQLVLRHRQPIRPGRAFPRNRKHRLKFSMNLRRPT